MQGSVSVEKKEGDVDDGDGAQMTIMIGKKMMMMVVAWRG